jgi:DNA damage-inducible protein 1
MLYINAVVNGVPIRAFVDSGAQMTIMSKAAAERCGIMRLMDTKYQGTAVGVGKASILGRIHMAPLVIGTTHFPFSVTVLEQGDMPFLFGLDMLKRYAACIDLKDGVLRLEVGSATVAVPFLSERESKSSLEGGSPRAGDAAGREGAGAMEESGGSGAAGAGAGARAGARAGAPAAEGARPSTRPPVFDFSKI